MFTPEREAHPAVAEIKYLMSPVVFLPRESYVDADCLRVKVDMHRTNLRFDVKNRYTFSTLDHLDWSWSLTSNRASGPIRGGSFAVSGSADKLEALVDLDSIISRVILLERSRTVGVNSYFLNLQGALKVDATWGNAGHVIVTQQFAVKFLFPHIVPPKAIVQKSPLTSLSWKHEGDTLRIDSTVVGGGAISTMAIFDKQSGALVSYSPVTDNLLAGPLVPNFTRAATDNDKGGLEQPLEFLFPGMRLQYLFGLLHNLDNFSYWSRWKLVGLDALAPPAMQCSAIRVKESTDQTYLDVEVDSIIRCVPNAMTLFHMRILYRMFTNGRVRVNYRVDPTSVVARITSLPRVGVNLQLLSSFFKISYFGRGPEENYTDRKSGSFLGHYQTTPVDMGYYKYIVPGENGSRSDCEWIAFRGGPGDGLLIASMSKKDAFSCSALIYSAAELDQASHTYDLPERGNGEAPIHVNIDHQLMGVGGDTRYVLHVNRLRSNGKG
jgi:beta-galactosidase